MVVCLEQGADLHMAQLMPLPLTVSCFSKTQIGFTFLVPAHLGSPGKKAVKRVCVCVYSDTKMTCNSTGGNTGAKSAVNTQHTDTPCTCTIVQRTFTQCLILAGSSQHLHPDTALYQCNMTVDNPPVTIFTPPATH